MEISTLKKIKELAPIYAPQWRFTEEDPDMGTALSLLFAHMTEKNIEKFRQLPKKYQIDFFNRLGADFMPAREANGHVTFALVNEDVPGILIPENTQVIGESEKKEQVTYETKEEVYVSPACCKAMYHISGNMDTISEPLSFPVSIGYEERKNQQSHIFLMGHSDLLHIETEGEIVLDFHFGDIALAENLCDWLKKNVAFSYYGEEGFLPFLSPQYKDGRIYLYKDKKMPAFVKGIIEEKESYWICMEVKRMKAGHAVKFPSISLVTRASHMLPSFIYDGEKELEREMFMPFGEKPYPFRELYIASDEVFSKKNAHIQLHFHLEWLEYAGEITSPEKPAKWKAVMHKSEFEEKVSPNIMINMVVWEYYNGLGWSKIPESKQYETLFRREEEQGSITMHLICPGDSKPFLVAAKETHCIRVRVMKIENLYMADGVYITPVISNMTMGYVYETDNIMPEYAYAKNQMEVRAINCSREFTPFINTFENRNMLYLLFSKPLQEAMIRILFVLKESMHDEGIQYVYEYYGKDGFKELRVIDETSHFTKTGIVTLAGEHDFSKLRLLKEEGYWMRISAVDKRQNVTQKPMKLPCITGMYINSVKVKATGENGKAGNLSKGMVCILPRSLGYVKSVCNYEEMTGGFDQENQAQALSRNAAWVKNQKRAVTARDYEDMVRTEFRNVLQVKCFSGMDEMGFCKQGHITLAVLAENYRNESRNFEALKESIVQYLLKHMDRRLYDEGRMHIVEPVFLKMNTYINVVLKSNHRMYQKKEMIKEKISTFINPVTGNFDGKGWRIGNLPTALQIQNACSQMKEIQYIKNVSLQEEDKSSPFIIGIDGTHELSVGV